MTESTLDIENHADLIAYLRAAGHISAREVVRPRTLSGGVSNRAVLVELPERPNNAGWVLKQALAKLRVAVDWFSDPARIEREALGLTWLARLAPPHTITPLIFEDRAHHLLAMAAVAQPHENWKTLLLAGKVVPDHVRQFGALLGQVHRQSWIGRQTLAEKFADRRFFESLRIEPYYQYTAAQCPHAAEFLKTLVCTTRQRALSVVHGDFSPKNVLIHEDRLILLDHEVIHFGDPAFDVGFAIAHFLSKARHLPAHRQAFQSAALLFWQTYFQAVADVPWSADVEVHAIHHSLGCLLARVAGRSPLEYLDAEERQSQRQRVIALMQQRVESIESLIAAAIEHT